MENFAQRRIIRKIDLIHSLSLTYPHPSPKAYLEQYTITVELASSVLYLAAYNFGDVLDKRVLELGCGTGRLALGASFLGAKEVVGVDIDREAIAIAYENSVKVGLKNSVQWVIGDIKTITGSFDTVLQNPPFGVQKRKADREFLEKALQVGSVVYSLHNHPVKDKRLLNKLKAETGSMLEISPSPFIKKIVETNHGTVKSVYAVLFSIPNMFKFHRRQKYEFVVDLYLIESDGFKD